MPHRRPGGRLLAFGEIFSENVGDGVIFECLRHGMAERGTDILPADLSLRNGYLANPVNAVPAEAGMPRRFARYFVRRSVMLRRMINVARWVAGGRRRFVDRHAQAVNSCDGVIIGGGQLLVDRQLCFPLALMAIMDMARAANKPVAIYSCGADPEAGWTARRILHRLTRDAIHIAVRDRISADALLALDGRLAINVRPDIGFLAGRVYAAGGAAPEHILGVNVMPLQLLSPFLEKTPRIGPSEYVALWRDLVQAALGRGWRVTLMTNGDINDCRVAHEIHSAFDDDRVQLAPPPRTPGELAGMLQDVNALISCRMHAGIVAYSLGKRIVPLVWDRKVEGVWKTADPAVRPLPLDAFLDGRLSISDILDRALSEPASAGGNVIDRRKAVMDEVDRSLDELAACFGKIATERAPRTAIR